jgi:hypothetical protein
MVEIAPEVGLGKVGRIGVDRCFGDVGRSFLVAIVVWMA